MRERGGAQKTPTETFPPGFLTIYKLEDSSTVIVRPSGTEPKIKTYFTTKGKDLSDAQAKKDKLADACKPLLS